MPAVPGNCDRHIGIIGATGVLATLALPNPGTVSGSVFTLLGVPVSVAASASGTAALAEFRNNAGTTVVSGLSVGATAGFDIILGTVTITAPGIVTITAGTITHG